MRVHPRPTRSADVATDHRGTLAEYAAKLAELKEYL